MSTAFDNVRLPDDVEQGALMGPSFDTGIIALSGGSEQRNANWDQERVAIDISYGITDKESPDDREDSYIRILNFFRARMGRQRSFLFRDHTDYEAVAEPLVSPKLSANKLQLSKSYGYNYHRRITRPDPTTVELFFNDTPVPPGGYTVGTEGQPDYIDIPSWQLIDGGVIQFSRDLTVFYPQLNASFEFDIPVRFDIDKLQVSLLQVRAGSVPGITLIQVREGEAI